MRMLVVCLCVEEGAEGGGGVGPEDEPAQLVQQEDEEGEGEGRHPPARLQGVEANVLGHLWRVEEEEGQQGLQEEGRVEEPVGEALGEDGHLPGLADHQVRPLGLRKYTHAHSYAFACGVRYWYF